MLQVPSWCLGQTKGFVKFDPAAVPPSFAILGLHSQPDYEVNVQYLMQHQEQVARNEAHQRKSSQVFLDTYNRGIFLQVGWRMKIDQDLTSLLDK